MDVLGEEEFYWEMMICSLKIMGNYGGRGRELKEGWKCDVKNKSARILITDMSFKGSGEPIRIYKFKSIINSILIFLSYQNSIPKKKYIKIKTK